MDQTPIGDALTANRERREGARQDLHDSIEEWKMLATRACEDGMPTSTIARLSGYAERTVRHYLRHGTTGFGRRPPPAEPDDYRSDDRRE